MSNCLTPTVPVKPSSKKIDGKYGYFDLPTREFVITDPRTPTKWINYIGSLKFGGIIDQTGGALLCAGDPGLNRITKYIPQLPAGDFRGTTLYIRLKKGDSYELLCPFFTPALVMPESFECRVGLGYQKFKSQLRGLLIEVTIFVPVDEAIEIRDIQITNLTEEAQEVEVIPVVEYSHFDALKQFANADWVPQTMQSESFTSEDNKTLLYQYAFMNKGNAVNYFSASRPASSFETDRHRFLGNNDYGTWANPLALQKDQLSNYEARRGDNIGALLIPLGKIAPQQTEQVSCFLGQAEPSQAITTVQRYSEHSEVQNAFSELSTFWDNYLSVFQCETPDSRMNAMLNVHNARQCYMTMNWSRYLSLYQLGIGTRGLGFRDSSQDVLGAMAGAPDGAKELICKLLSIQLSTGAAMHQFYPKTMHADHGDAEEEDSDKKIYGDDHLWIIQSVCQYLKETGDLDFLDTQIPYYDEGTDSVFEHLKAALAYTKSHCGTHGLPLLGFADWNDCVNLPGASESLFNACLYGRGLLEMIELCQHIEQPELAAQYTADHAHMAEVVNTCWDGDWYVRYYTDDGQPIGSKSNTQGSLYTNAQSWPILAGFAPPERAQRALDSVRERHNTRYGIMLSSPGYDSYDPDIGGITTYPPGAKENGGIFLHSNPWVIIAETMLGNGDRAYEYYDQISPIKRMEDVNLYEIEPYCYAQNILGDEHPQFGLGRNSWLSGTASWMYFAATKYILGIQPGYSGLKIDPCIPKEWPSLTISRKIRGASYDICIQNPNNINKGIASIKVNGTAAEDQHIPYASPGDHVKIEVTLGSKA